MCCSIMKWCSASFGFYIFAIGLVIMLSSRFCLEIICYDVRVNPNVHVMQHYEMVHYVPVLASVSRLSTTAVVQLYPNIC